MTLIRSVHWSETAIMSCPVCGCEDRPVRIAGITTVTLCGGCVIAAAQRCPALPRSASFWERSAGALETLLKKRPYTLALEERDALNDAITLLRREAAKGA